MENLRKRGNGQTLVEEKLICIRAILDSATTQDNYTRQPRELKSIEFFVVSNCGKYPYTLYISIFLYTKQYGLYEWWVKAVTSLTPTLVVRQNIAQVRRILTWHLNCQIKIVEVYFLVLFTQLSNIFISWNGLWRTIMIEFTCKSLYYSDTHRWQ